MITLNENININKNTMTTINWRKVKNTVSERMIDRSLAHKFIIPDDNFKQMKIKTIIFNRLLQSRCYTYKRYVQLKKSMIKIISEEKDIESLNDIDHIFDKFILPIANDDIDTDIDNNNYNSDQSNNSLDNNNKDTELNEVDESANVNDTDENRIIYSNQCLDHQLAEEQLNSNNNNNNNNNNHNEHEIFNDSDDDGNASDSMKQYHQQELSVTTNLKTDSEDDIDEKYSPLIHNDADDDNNDGNVGDLMKQYDEKELSVTTNLKTVSENDIYNKYSPLIHNDSDDNDDDGNVSDSTKQYDEKELSVTTNLKTDSEDDIYNKYSPLIHNDSDDNNNNDDDDNLGDSVKQYNETELPVTTKLKSDSEDDIDNNYSSLIHNDVGDDDNDIDDDDDKQSSTSGKNKTQVKITNYEVVTSKYTIIKDKNKIVDHQNLKNANKQSLNINENNNFNSVITLPHSSSDNDDDDDINNDSLNYYHLKEKRKLKIDNNKSYGPSLIATPRVSESLEYVLKNLPFREYYSQPKENDDLSSSYVNNNSDISDYDIDGYIEDELMSKRPTDIDNFAISRKLITLSSTQSSCTFEDLNEDDEILVMDIPKSIIDKGNLEGQSMKLKKRSIKIGDTRYKISIKDNDEFTCVFRLNNRDDLYKIENIQPVKSIVIQEPQSTPDKRDSFDQDNNNIVKDFEDPIHFPNNLKTRNPLLLDHQQSIKLKHSKRKENDSLQNDSVKSKKVKIL
ncbi:probable serine/threonine-protein kinase DDB_G0283337 [Microplitis mediator]|uniref:probable serine/threonine-protein kinase DDB_G0283337 n=1 Tax=Microplitis mediator TaxID=375433 RepID=UPI0025560DC3|nr:probable serine/threonine-protein kinase DDB_G0283337 [Microplitis mediator]XP_057328757.1 probable serine/threonine-protein kinase DDB_G0283337 [Microplitis mediator]